MSQIITYQRFWQRRDTAANWTAANPVLHAGEFGVETDTGGKKLGDGVTAWNSLAYDTSPFFAVATGTNTLAATFAPKPVLKDGLELRVRAAAANTGAATFNPNSLGALAITKQGGTALAAGDIAAAGHELILRYRASPARYELLNPAGGASSSATGTIGCTFDGGDDVLEVGTFCDVVVPADCTITAATSLADQSGSLVVAVWADTYGNYPPTAADNIAASAPPTISAALKARDTTLTGWTTALVAGRTVRFSIVSCSAIKRATITLEVLKT